MIYLYVFSLEAAWDGLDGLDTALVINMPKSRGEQVPQTKRDSCKMKQRCQPSRLQLVDVMEDSVLSTKCSFQLPGSTFHVTNCVILQTWGGICFIIVSDIFL